MDETRLEQLLDSLENPKRLLSIIASFIEAPPTKYQEIVVDHPELLTSEADDILRFIAESQDNENSRNIVENSRLFLQRCKQIGVTDAFTEITNTLVPSQFQQDITQANRALQTYFQTSNLDALNESITILEQVIAHPIFQNAPANFQWATMNNAAVALRYRFSIKNQLRDLDKALTFMTVVIKRTPANSPSYPNRLSNLGMIYSERYVLTGQLSDLSEAIRVTQEAVQLISDDNPNRPITLSNLGVYLSDRYERTGQIIDLDEAIQVTQEAIQSVPSYSSGRPSILSNLGNRLRNRYLHTRQQADIDQAVQITQEAIELVLSNSPDLPMYLHSLGVHLGTRYEEVGQRVDLDEAIQITQKAVQLTPPDAVNLGMYLASLGNLFYLRYTRDQQQADLDEAIRVTQVAIQQTPEHSPDLPKYLNNLGWYFGLRYTDGQRLDDKIKAKEWYEIACQKGLILTIAEAVRSSRNWGHWTLGQKEWLEAVQAYDYGIKAIDYLYQVQLQRPEKEIWLRSAQGIHTNYAYAYAQTGQLKNAITSIEHGRAFLLSENLERLRTDLEHLPELGYTDLHQTYQNILNQIWVLENQAQVDIDRLRVARTKLDTTIEQIHQIEGYEDFLRLQPNLRKDILAAMTNKQIILVYTAVTHVGSVTLIVQPSGTVTEVWLDDLTDKILREKIQGPDDEPDIGGFYAAYAQRRDNPVAWLQMMDDITHWLWSVLMGPLVEKIKSLPDTNEINQVVLIPQGLLGLLPLHAAWTEDATRPTGRLYALDEFLFTYSPNARALKASRERAAANPPDSIFAVDNPDQSLVFAEPEVTTALAYFPENKRMRLTPENISFEKVTDCLRSYSVAHFATHGWANPTPLESSLSLGSNKAISLRSILNLRLQKARLAILSACESAIPGRELPDEVIGLPSGLVQAGFAGVVGSLWAVPDQSTMILMMRFYELWCGKNLAPPEALRQAQIWLRDSSRSEKRQYFKGIRSQGGDKAIAAKTALNALLPPEAGNFQHPYHWAAFSYTGI